MVKASLRRCEKINILFPQSGTKAQRKANSNFFNVFANLCGFARLREPVWLFNRFLHSFCVIHRRIGIIRLPGFSAPPHRNQSQIPVKSL
jgi:hypothetical protein